MRTGRTFHRAFTLVEVMLSLIIIAILSVGVTTLLITSVNVDRAIRTQNQADSKVNFALHRIINNIRTAGAAPTWVLNTGVSPNRYELTATGTGASTAVKYFINATGDLVEDDSRYETGSVPNVLIPAALAPTFSCVVTAPQTGQNNTYVQLDLAATCGVSVERHVMAVCRGY